MYARLRKYPLLFKIIKKIYIFVRGTSEAICICIRALYFQKQLPVQSILCCISNPASYGGGELQFQVLALELRDKKLAHTFISVGHFTNDPKKELFSKLIEQGFDHVHLGNVKYVHQLAPQFLKRVLSRLLKRFNTPILHIFNLRCESLIPAAKAIGMSIIYSEFALPCEEPLWHQLQPHVHLLDLVVAVSQQSLASFRSVCGYRGLAQVIFPLIQQPKANQCARSFQRNRFDVVHFARMTPGKRGDVLIQAFAEVLAHYPYSTLTLIGNGETRRTLQALAYKLKLQNKVQFLDFLETEALFTRICDADVFCLPSISEGTPCSILEAMAVGLPVIATAVGGIPELVIHGKTGLLVQPDDSRDLERALLLLAKEPALREEMSASAKIIYTQKYHENSIKAQWMAIYEDFLK